MTPTFVSLLSQPVFSPPYNYLRAVLDLAPLGFWPLGEASGTTAYDRSGNAHDGTYTGASLGEPGLFNKTCPLFDGANDYANLLSAGLTSAFNGGEATIAVWLKVYDSSVWTDGVNRYALIFGVDLSTNYILLRKGATANLVSGYYVAGSVTKFINMTTSSTGWLQVAITASASADQVKCYLNGAQAGSTLTGLGTWSGSIARAVIGAASVTPGNVFNGWLQYAMLWDRALTPGEVASLYVA